MDLSHGRYWDESWSPVRGCVPCAARCWASRMAQRFSGPGQPYEGLTKGGVWTGEQRFIAAELWRPLHRRKPTVYAVGWMGDTFGPGVLFDQIAAIYGIMAACPQHTFLVLSKHSARRREWLAWLDRQTPAGQPRLEVCFQALRQEVLTHPDGDSGPLHTKHAADPEGAWPLPNVWEGSSMLTQTEADRDLPILLATPAAHRWASLEPMLEGIHLDNGETSWLSCSGVQTDGECCESFAVLGHHHFAGLDAVVCGGESGPRARPCDVAWLRSVAEQCGAAGTPCLVKQAGAKPYDSEHRWYTAGSIAVPTDGTWFRSAGFGDRAGADAGEWPSGLSRGSVPWAR